MPSSSLGSIYFLIKDVVTLSIGDLFDGMAAMTIIGEQLFCNWYLDDDLRYRAGAGLRQAVDWMLGDEFAKHTDEELVNRVVAEASMTPLEVSFDEKRKADPIKINVTGRPDYGFDRRPTWTDGIRVTQTIPFKDNRNRDLWRMSTNPCTSNPPYGEIRAEALVVGKEVPVSEADQLTTSFIGRILVVFDGNAALPALPQDFFAHGLLDKKFLDVFPARMRVGDPAADLDDPPARHGVDVDDVGIDAAGPAGLQADLSDHVLNRPGIVEPTGPIGGDELFRRVVGRALPADGNALFAHAPVRIERHGGVQIVPERDGLFVAALGGEP
jgi:hypothetical protein